MRRRALHRGERRLSAAGPTIPWAAIDALLLDAGNTLVSIDFAWVAEELAARGVRCTPEALERAEAAARPAVSDAAARRLGTEGEDAFQLHLREVLARLEAGAALGAAERSRLAAELAPALRAPGTVRLWSRVIPGVPEALAELRARGLRMAVVSNSDGTVEESLERLGLRGHFDAVFDSHLVGYEKPDPRIFRRALEALGAPAGRALHVGDLYAADVVGARAAGVHALLLDPYGDWDGVEGLDCARAPDLACLARRLRA